jgi:hypothetical protein
MIAIGVLCSAIVLGTIVSTCVHAAPASPTFTVLDTANLFTPSEVDAITKKIAERRANYDQKVIVYTVPASLRADLPTYAAKLKKYWDVQRVIVIKAPSAFGATGVIGDSSASTASPYRDAVASVLQILSGDDDADVARRVIVIALIGVVTAILVVITVCIIDTYVIRPRRYR